MDKLEIQKQAEKGNTTFTLRISNIANKKIEEILNDTGSS